MKAGKRLLSYFIEVFVMTIGTILFFAIFALLTYLISLIFVPLFVSENHVAIIIEKIVGFSTIFGIILFMISYLYYFTFRQRTIGYFIFGLRINSNNRIALLLKFFIHFGSLMILYLCDEVLRLESMLFDLATYTYLVYHFIDGIMLMKTKGNETFTDRWLGMKVVEVAKKS